jgi:hypothetical protein
MENVVREFWTSLSRVTVLCGCSRELLKPRGIGVGVGIEFLEAMINNNNRILCYMPVGVNALKADPDADPDPDGWIGSPRCAGQTKATVTNDGRLMI